MEQYLQKHHELLDDPMDIEEAIASAKKLHTPSRPAKDQLPGEGAGPSGLTPEALLPGLPAGAAVPAGPSKKGRAKSLVEVPPRAPRPQRKAATIYASLNEAAMRKQNAQRTTAPQAAETGKSQTSQPDSKPNEPRLCAPMTGIRDDLQKHSGPSITPQVMTRALQLLPSLQRQTGTRTVTWTMLQLTNCVADHFLMKRNRGQLPIKRIRCRTPLQNFILILSSMPQ
jgi:hypothetical protein